MSIQTKLYAEGNRLLFPLWHRVELKFNLIIIWAVKRHLSYNSGLLIMEQFQETDERPTNILVIISNNHFYTKAHHTHINIQNICCMKIFPAKKRSISCFLVICWLIMKVNLKLNSAKYNRLLFRQHLLASNFKNSKCHLLCKHVNFPTFYP